MIISHLSKKELNSGPMLNFDLYYNAEKIANVYLCQEEVTEFGNIYNMEVHAFSTDETLSYEYYQDRLLMFAEMRVNVIHTTRFIDNLGRVVYEDNLEDEKEPTIDDIVNDEGHYLKQRFKLVAKKDLVEEIENGVSIEKPYIKSLINKS